MAPAYAHIKRKRPRGGATAAALALLLGLAPAVAAAGGKQAVGWVEQAELLPGPVPLKAKLDTGAKTSSLRVTRIKRFTHNGHPWIRFTLTDATGKAVTLQRPQVRTVLIKRHGSAPKPRPVVMINVCVGSVFKRAQVDLTTRGDFIYPLLVGRRFLSGHFIVDPGRTFVTRPHCKHRP